MTSLHTPLDLRLPARLAKKLATAGLCTVGDLLHHAPRRYYHWGTLTAMHSLQFGQDVTLLARVVSCVLRPNRNRGGVRLEVTLTDGTTTMSATFFGKNQYSLIPHQKLLTPGSTHLFAGKVGQYRGALQLTHPQFEETSGDDESVSARQQRPIPIYPLTHGLTPWVIQRAIAMILDELHDDDIPELLDADIRATYNLLTYARALRMLHQPASDEDYRNAQRTLRWHEAYTLQVALRGQRNDQQRNHSFPAPKPNQGSLAETITADLPFTLTDSQQGAVDLISADLAKDSPMMRLLQGDVGSGKTIVALLAAAQAIDAGYQVAFLVPTEVLAEQHTQSLRASIPQRVKLSVELLTSSTTASNKKRIHALLENGEPILLVGTHALLHDSVPFRNLGLIIVDEQHRFGVAQRDTLRQRVVNTSGAVPHQLVMTATPIPRTVAMTVFGDLEETRMIGLPPGRTPVQTYTVDATNAAWMERLWQRAYEEITNGGRVYVVCPRIDPDDPSNSTPAQHSEDEALADMLIFDEVAPTVEASTQPAPPFASVSGVASFLSSHPQLGPLGVATLTSRNTSEEKAQIMADFAQGRRPILVATTVIEVGVNVPEATMMIILDAQQFGLSQLHQLRGRVGRSDRPSICMAVHRAQIPDISRERLEAFANTSDGFELARVDVKLRKEGDVLGAGQSGRASSLKFLSVVRDSEIIAQAREAAIETIDADPLLADHPQLASYIRDLHGQDAQWMEKA